MSASTRNELPADSPDHFDWVAFRRRWSSIVPLAAASLLAEVGAVLSVMFRTSPPPPGSGPSGAILYVSSLLPVPVLVACLLIGYTWARLALSLVLWSSAACMLANVVFMFLMDDALSAFVLAPFFLCALFGLRRVHGSNLKVVLIELDAQRRLRWGAGFGWMLTVSTASIVATASVAILVLEYIRVAGGPGGHWAELSGPLRFAPVVAGGAVVAAALARMPTSRSPMRWLLLGNLALLLYVAATDPGEQRRAFALTALAFDGLALVALGRPTLHTYCERQRLKLATGRPSGGGVRRRDRPQ